MGILERRFRKSLRKRVRRGFRGYPVATVAYYGPDDQRASKVAVGITNGEGQEVAELRRWFSETGDVRFTPSSAVEFIEAHSVRTVAGVERMIGCDVSSCVHPVGTGARLAAGFSLAARGEFRRMGRVPRCMGASW